MHRFCSPPPPPPPPTLSNRYFEFRDFRDLKPENILLVGKDNDVDVKITDFGLAKRANKEGLKTFCGTPQYFAPEVLKRRNTVLGVGRYGKEADMWSVGEDERGGC